MESALSASKRLFSFPSVEIHFKEKSIIGRDKTTSRSALLSQNNTTNVLCFMSPKSPTLAPDLLDTIVGFKAVIELLHLPEVLWQAHENNIS